MNRVAFAVTSLALVSCAWSQNDRTKGLIEAAKHAKITLADAVQKAGATVGGTVVSAVLETPREKGLSPSYAVLVLRDGALVAVAVDALSGEVGKPKGVAGEDHAAEEGAKRTALDTLMLDFEDAPHGQPPKGFAVTETNGRGTPGAWRVEQDKEARSGKQALTLAETKNSGETFNMLLSEAVLPADLELSVQIRANTGDEDRGGGLVWRAKDGGNYYVTRWNPLEKNLRCYKVVGHRRSMLTSADVDTDAKAWHRIEVRTKGKGCEISFDGKRMLTFEDDAFPGAGRIGLWTKADAASSFDDLTARGVK